MSAAIDLLRDAGEQGLTLWLDEGQLRYKAMQPVSDELKGRLRQYKAEIISLLAIRPGGVTKAETPARTWTPGNPSTCSCGHVTGWQLAGEPLCPVCFHKLHGADSPDDRPDTNPPRQVACQAMEHSGVLMSTASKYCLEWQCQYCKGCEVLTVQ